MDVEPTGSRGARLLSASLALAIALALLVAALHAARDGYLSEGLSGLAPRSAARRVPTAAAVLLLPALLLAWIGRRGGYRAPVAVLTGALVAGAYLVSGALWPEGTPVLPGPRASLLACLAAFLVGALALPLGARLGARTAWPTGIGAALVLLLCAAVRLLAPAPGSVAGPAHLILISLDTLRADHLGCYGYPEETSPALDRLAAESMRFTSAYTPQPWTLTAHMTMLTSLYPSVHGVYKHQGLSDSVRPLAVRLREAGYATYGVVDRVEWLHPRFGFDRGFDLYLRLPDDGARKVDRILRLLDDHGDAPFFLFAHFYDAHSDWRRLPYESEPEDRERFAGWYRGPFTGCGAPDDCASEHLATLAEEGRPLTGDDREYVVALYDAGIRSLDRQLERLFAGLRERGLYEDAVILVTSDHGEEFFEHGGALHVQQGYAECLRVPLLLRRPDGVRGTSDQLVGLTDVMPTLLDFAGASTGACQGTSLRAARPGATLAEGRPRILFDGRWELFGLRSGPWWLVDSGTSRELYDVASDPLQERDLAGEPALADVLAELELLREEERARLLELRAAIGPGAATRAPSDEARARLEALGYADDG